MYAVIRAGGKQYRVAPGDVIQVEKFEGGDDGRIEFSDILAVSTDNGMAAAGDNKVVGEIVGEGRGDKILVFHYKRKKQYKKLNGHRQPFTAVRITEILADGQSFRAPEVQAAKTGKPKATEGGAAPEGAVKGKKGGKGGSTDVKGHEGAGSDTSAQHGGGYKKTGSKS